jgi:hypothetical protein
LCCRGGFAPTSTLLVALLAALVGGFILLDVFNEEIPSGLAAGRAFVAPERVDDLRRVADPGHRAELIAS